MNLNDSEKICPTHQKPFEFICLDEECSENFLLCRACKDSNAHKHSKTTIEVIVQVQQKLKSTWDLKDNKITPFYKKVREFYDKLRKEITEAINQDQKIVESLLEKISCHHLPMEANSLAYLEFKKEQYERLDKASILKLISEAEYGEANKNLEQQKEILNLLEVELSKTNDKVMTLKYVMLSKKMQAQLLSPKMSENSKVCQYDEITKIYGLFNSKNLLIRHAKLLHRASVTGFSHKEFFNSCNNLPNCMALAKLENGRKVGGFSAVPVVNPHNEEAGEELVYERDRSKRSFIFSVSQLGSYQLKDSAKAIAYRKDASGPIFGPDLDLSGKRAASSIGHSYSLPEGYAVDSLESKVILLGSAEAPISELEIWQLCF